MKKEIRVRVNVARLKRGTSDESSERLKTGTLITQQENNTESETECVCEQVPDGYGSLKLDDKQSL